MHIGGEKFLQGIVRAHLRFLRLPCSCLKYSGPRLAISFPPFRPSLTAAGSLVFAKIQKVQHCLPTVLCTTFLAMSAALIQRASVFPYSLSLRGIAGEVVI